MMTKKTLSIIGIGAFGRFMLKHVVPYFDVRICDSLQDLSGIAQEYNVCVCDLDTAATSDIVVIAVPVQVIEEVVVSLKDLVSSGQLVMDLASVKCLPSEILQKHLPEGVDIVGLHPLFGPQSGKNGIEGHNIAVVNVRGDRDQCVADFLADTLKLSVIQCTAEEHDEQMAYVQGLTHMIAKVFQMMDMPEIYQETRTFSLLRQMVNIVKDDSDALFKAIQTDNPFVGQTKKKFFDAVKELEQKLENF